MADPRLVEHLTVVLALAVFAACFLRFRQFWFMPGYSGYLLTVHQTVVDGTAIAPNQYRPLIPFFDRWLADAVGLAVPQAIVAVDAVLLAVPVAALTSVLARHGQTVLLLPAASGFAFWFAKLDAWSPETMLLIALVTVVVRELERGPRWSLVLACGLLMLGARADYAAALGVTLLVVAWALRC